MDNNAENVGTGSPKPGGSVHAAPAGTAVPIDATSELGTAFANMGFVTDDGLKNKQKLDIAQIDAWGAPNIASKIKSYVETWALTFLENKSDVFKFVYGSGNVVLTSANAWAASHAYSLNDTVAADGKLYKVTTAGTSGSTVPTFPATGTVTDGTVTWTYVSVADPAISVMHGGDERDEWVLVFEIVVNEHLIKRIVIPRAKVTVLDDVSYKDSDGLGYGCTITAYPDATNKTSYEHFAEV